MNVLKYLLPFFLVLLFLPIEAESQVVRRKRTVVVTKKGNKRITRRQVRHVNRRNRYRTVRRLPAGTRTVVYRNVSYRPVRGVYFVRRGGVYVRTRPPLGFRIARLTGAILRLSVSGVPYAYSEGVFYQESNEGFEVVAPPKGAVIETLPEGAESMLLEDMTAYELYETLYQETDAGYEVIGTLEDFE
ncbi:MAG: hypothetical protein HRT65_11690 [Flavobacteriaceae bacterium]|nr:hypothetical protein [Flavobacteriaceae bacterium]